MPSLLLQDGVVLLAIAAITYGIYTKLTRKYPPGPPGLPLVGNLYDHPQEDPWVHYKEMGEKYNSELIYLNLAGSPMIIANTLRVARDLFEKRHKLYSDRPPSTMINELIGFKWDYGFCDYNEEWKKCSTLLIRELAPAQMNEFHKPVMVDSSRYLLGQLLEKPNDMNKHIRHTSGRTILSICYGIKTKGENDPFVLLAEKATFAQSLAGNHGSFLVDSFPMLKHIPEWFPGAEFKRNAKEWRKAVVAMPKVTMEFVKDALKAGNAPPSMAARHLQKMQDDGTLNDETEERLAGVCGASYVGGSDSTVAGLESFFLIMLQFPNIMKKAQEQIDQVVGRERLPDYSDEPNLPYVTALLKEMLRSRPVAPLASAHYIKTDDVYEGYYIPKNSIVLGNSWAILNDPELYGTDAHEFKPERFLNKDGSLNPNVMHPDAAFGFGRRICPGKALAQHSLFMSMSSVLWAYNVEMIPGKEPSGKYTTGLLSRPEPFECSVSPRHAGVAPLIRAALAQQ